jgi:hypothetical protein
MEIREERDHEIPNRKAGGGRVSILLKIAGVILLVLLMVWARALYGAAEAHRQGRESLDRNRISEAITYFDRAVHWYAPCNPWVASSAEMLWALSEKAESEGDDRLALRALNAIRSGFVAANGLLSPGREWIRRCEERIEKLSTAASGDTVPPLRPMKGEEGGAKRGSPPDLFWTFVLEAGLFGWIGSVIWLILGYGLKKRALPGLLKWSALLVLFFAAWIVGMMKA